jgi:3-oxoacyl-[acyl-carrier-protein] synthase II
MSLDRTSPAAAERADAPELPPRVVITGIGLVTSVGNDTASTWEALLAGRSGVGRVREFDPAPFDVQIAAEVQGFDPRRYLEAKDVRRNDRFVHMAVAAAQQALEDARYVIEGEGEDVGVVIGSGGGGMTTLGEQFHVLFYKGPSRISPFMITQMVVDMPAGVVAQRFGLRGPNFATVSACATSAHAIGESWEIIRRGDARAMVTGGTEFAPTTMSLAAFAKMGALSRRNDEPERASRPFDAGRDGFVIGSGAGVLLLERLDDARARGAPIYAEIVGYAATADAHHITEPAPGGAGLVRAMRRALRKAELPPEAVDYVNAHGTSTKFNDRDETTALHTVFGEHAPRLAISATKSMIGHTMGAAGGIETAVTALTLKHGVITPTINYEVPDPECDLDYVPNEARRADVRVAMKESMGFGGHNAVLVLRRYDGD